MAVGARRSSLLLLSLVAITITIITMPRATAFLLRSAAPSSSSWALGVGRHCGSSCSSISQPRLALRMGLDRSSRPTPRGPGFRFVRASTALGSSSAGGAGDDFAAIGPQTLNWEKVGPEEDVFISALSQNGQVGALGRVRTCIHTCD